MAPLTSRVAKQVFFKFALLFILLLFSYFLLSKKPLHNMQFINLFKQSRDLVPPALKELEKVV